MIRILGFSQMGRLLARRTTRLREAEAVVRPILEAVRKRGDKALVAYARKLDGLERKTVRVPERELVAACGKLAPGFRAAIETASRNIRTFAEMQMPVEQSSEFAPGLWLGQIVRPLDTVAAPVAPPDSRGVALAQRIDQVKWSVSCVGSVTTSRNAFGRATPAKLV